MNEAAISESERALPKGGEGWRTFFGAYRDIVLVANSDAVKVADLDQLFGEGTLFVFFNKVYKVLDRPFARPALLACRSSEAGANIVYRREVGELVPLFDPATFLGFLNIRAAPQEVFSQTRDFGGRPAGFLDLVGHFKGFYSPAHIPSSGFALAVWLAEQDLDARIHLAGFTGRRSGRWKVFRVHDWTFEQTVQRALLHAGRLHDASAASVRNADAVERIARRFPALDRLSILALRADVLAERLDDGDAATDELIAVTRWQKTLRSFFRRLKPRTRKEKLASARARSDP